MPVNLLLEVKWGVETAWQPVLSNSNQSLVNWCRSFPQGTLFTYPYIHITLPSASRAISKPKGVEKDPISLTVPTPKQTALHSKWCSTRKVAWRS